MEPCVQHITPIAKRVPFEFQRHLVFLSRYRTSIQTEAKLFVITGYDAMGVHRRHCLPPPIRLEPGPPGFEVNPSKSSTMQTGAMRLFGTLQRWNLLERWIELLLCWTKRTVEESET